MLLYPRTNPFSTKLFSAASGSSSMSKFVCIAPAETVTLRNSTATMKCTPSTAARPYPDSTSPPLSGAFSPSPFNILMLSCYPSVLEPRIRASPSGSTATAKRITNGAHGVISCTIGTHVCWEICCPRPYVTATAGPPSHRYTVERPGK